MMRKQSQGVAQTILNAYDAFFADFQNMTLGAKARFERADWPASERMSRERLELYKRKVSEVKVWLQALVYEQLYDRELWRQSKHEFTDLLYQRPNYDIAETFFNSVYCEVFAHQQIDPAYTFVYSSRRLSENINTSRLYRTYSISTTLSALVSQILDDYQFAIAYENKDRDVALIVSAVKQELIHIRANGRGLTHWIDGPQQAEVVIDVLEPIFYRNKGAYLVGRVIFDGEPQPFVLPLLNNEAGQVYVDTLISRPEDVSIIFSFTRRYFMVDSERPSDIVRFLRSLMPQKPIWELYSCIGFKKHAKTVFFRQFQKHNLRCEDKFIEAPGIKGMVMLVFTLPSFGIVFKVIRDRFVAPKKVTHSEVRAKYKLVTRHDRVGRMADTQEFSHFVFERKQFDSALLAELLSQAGSQVIEQGDKIIIRHLYAERYMTPLNLSLASSNSAEIESLMDEYGSAIRQMAAANIFPGDMLLKNFGVTRHGRVVFYDYDEICYLTDCVFRDLPLAQTHEQEMASSPWYSVSDKDVFPEEFALFFSGNKQAKEAFERGHSELYRASYWQTIQQHILSGNTIDVFPYRRTQRFNRKTPEG
jgi:isocitrate dehydrogenase kinase/phosphatase